MDRKRLFSIAKLLFSLGIVALLYWKVIERQGVAMLSHQLARLSFAWLALGFIAQVIAVGCSVWRWERLLVGQGIHAPWRHLIGSFMIARFFGEFAPGGWTGLNGYRLFDIAKQTGKIARATASIGIEMVLGWLSFGLVAITGSAFGSRLIGLRGVAIVDGFFLALIALSLALVIKPALFRVLASQLPAAIGGRLRSTLDAIGSYEGKGALLAEAAVLGVGIHFFRAFIYIASARALHADLSVGEVFFASTLQVFATLLPASVNGIGLREATAVALYTRVGVPGSVAVLIPTVGFLMELALSSSGGLVFLTRRVGYQVAISVEDPGREDRIQAQVPAVPVARQPRVRRGLALGISAGIVAGSIVGASEGLWIVHDSFGKPALSLLVYAVGSYSIAFAIVGGALGSMSALSGRWLAREAFAESTAFAHGTALLSVIGALAIATFRLERVHVYAPPAWSSGRALLVVLAAIAGYFAIARGLGAFSSRKIGAWLLRPWGAPLMAAGVVLPLTAAAALALRRAAPPIARPAPPSDAPDVLLIVVEEPLPSSGERSGETPYLERFAADAVRFESTFAAGATARSNLAAILSGRDPRRRASTSEKIVTLPEALRAAGYETRGVVNDEALAPSSGFGRGFDQFRYLSGGSRLGANESEAQLSLVRCLAGLFAKRAAGLVDRVLFEQLGQGRHSASFQFVVYARGTRMYDEEITSWDRHFGALLARLKGRGLYDAMAIVLTSDRGRALREATPVPLLIKRPGVRARGRVEARSAQSIDLMPTVLRSIDLAIPASVQGRDLFHDDEDAGARPLER